MTDVEISRRLALAIGWKEADIYHVGVDFVMIICSVGWARRFDYRDPIVIWPIAERFNAFPSRDGDCWKVINASYYLFDTTTDTAAKAAAIAVIKAQEQQK